MKKSSSLCVLVFLISVFALSSCKKQAQPVAITGKWYLKSYIAIERRNNVTDTLENDIVSVRDTSHYFEFYEGGKGVEAELPFFTIDFNYQVSGSSLFIPNGLDRIGPTSIITRIDPFNIVIKGTQSSGDAVITRELHLME